MKIQYCSDLHLEFAENRKWLLHRPLKVVGDVLVIAGDFYYLGLPQEPINDFLDWASANYRQVLIIPGNHEFYQGEDIAERGDSWQWMLRDNVGYYYNKVVRIDDVDFILSPMWSYILPRVASIVRRGMNDFIQIGYNGELLTTDNYNAEHAKCLKFIENAVEDSDAKTKIVVTHHLPTMKVCAPQFYASLLNWAFVARLDELIETSDINYWIYGHSHTNIDGQIGDTKIICNQLGYINAGEEKDFSREKFIEV